MVATPSEKAPHNAALKTPEVRQTDSLDTAIFTCATHIEAITQKLQHLPQTQQGNSIQLVQYPELRFAVGTAPWIYTIAVQTGSGLQVELVTFPAHSMARFNQVIDEVFLSDDVLKYGHFPQIYPLLKRHEMDKFLPVTTYVTDKGVPLLDRTSLFPLLRGSSSTIPLFTFEPIPQVDDEVVKKTTDLLRLISAL